MPPYITPAKILTMDLGVDLSGLSPAELASLCSQAKSMVDSHCLVPRLPQTHDFRGGTITGEQHSWRYPEGPFDIGQRRAYPFHWPVNSVDLFRIYVTNTQYVGIQPTELFINRSMRYVEVVSLALTSAGLFNALIIPNVGLATPTLTMDYKYGWTFSERGEALFNTDGRTWRAQNQWWFSDPAPVVYVNGAVQGSGYTLDTDEGTVVFDTALDDTAVVTLDYSFKLPWEIRDASAYVVAWLHAKSEMRARGMAELNRLKMGELEAERMPSRSRFQQTISSDLSEAVPEAAMLLATYRFDGVTVRG